MIECMRKEATRKTVTEQRWIPVSERLPNEDEFIKSYRRNKYAAEFIVMIKGANRPTTLYFTHDGWWTDNMKDRYDVTAWMPLPEPYREGEDSMERLTAKNDVGSHYFPKCFEKCGGLGASDKCENCENTISICEKLGAYEDAEEQGLLLRLPCKIGDTVYEIYRDGEYCSSWWDIRQRKFTLAFYEKHLNDFHKTVFLTQEEAEARLKDMEDSDGR